MAYTGEQNEQKYFRRKSVTEKPEKQVQVNADEPQILAEAIQYSPEPAALSREPGKLPVSAVHNFGNYQYDNPCKI
jgi:hypothetical protein